MLFNSLTFAIFFPIVFFIYWFVLKNSQKKQNIFLLIASYFFYGYWDWRFLFLLAISTLLLCYYCRFRINNVLSNTSRKTWMIAFAIVNLSILVFFKYFNFFIDSSQGLLQISELTLHIHTIKIILPVSISFCTILSLSYVLNYSNDSIYYHKKYFYNTLHMYSEGSKVFTKKLANDLMEMQLLPK